jgi:hypothetical protein
MTTATIEPVTNEHDLLEHAEQLREDLGLALGEEADESLAELERKEARDARFEELRGHVLSVTRSPVWEAHDLARDLLNTLEDLRDAKEDDADAADPEWREREALMRMRVVCEAMVRQLHHQVIDQPHVAAQFVATQLKDVGDAELGRLLDATPRMVEKYRAGVSEIRKDPHRIALIGQLVFELKNSRTPRGVLMWFDAPREPLEHKTPLELINQSVPEAFEILPALARGARGQLDV